VAGSICQQRNEGEKTKKFVYGQEGFWKDVAMMGKILSAKTGGIVHCHATSVCL
jgi:hypothetical protein